MTEEQVRKIVRDEIQEQLLKEDGLYDYARTAAINALIQMGFGEMAKRERPN
jgi:hypothetical protein